MIKNLKASGDIREWPNGSAVAVEGPSEVIVKVLLSTVKDMTEKMRIKVQQTELGESRIYCGLFTYPSGTD
jgi:hypothetical protein